MINSLTRVLVCVVTMLGIAPFTAAQPGNDQCPGFIFPGYLTIGGTTIGANHTSPSFTNCSGSTSDGPDVFYQFQAPCTGVYRFSLCGSAYDTVITIHTGCPATSANRIACNDNDCGSQSAVHATLTGGLIHIVRVSGRGFSTVGTFSLTVSPVSLNGTPANDACSNATPLSVGVPVTGSNACATHDGEATCGVSNNSSDVWYSLTTSPYCGGSYTLESCGSDFNTILSIHDGCPGALSNQVACNDTSCGAQASVTAVLAPGRTYYFRVTGFSAAVGNYNLNLVRGAGSPPSHDICANAVTMAAGVVYRGDTYCATPDGSSSCGFASAGTPDHWYRFTPPCAGTYTFSTCGSVYDTVISLHTGCTGNTFNEIACNDDSCGFQSRITASLAASTTYLVRVAGYSGATGPYQIEVTGDLSNDGCIHAIPIPAQGGSVTGSTACSTVDGVSACPVAGDVWYSFTPACGAHAIARIFSPPFNDGVVTVHTGCPGTPQNQIACGVSYLSPVVFPATAGATYYLGVSGLSGTFQLALSTLPNDSCISALRIFDGDTPFSTNGADTDGPGNACASLGSDIWYRYRAIGSGLVQASTCGASFPTILAVYDPAAFVCGGAGTPVACNTNGCGFQSLLRFRPANPSHDYLLRLGGLVGLQGCGVLNVRQFCTTDVDDGTFTGRPDGGITIEDLLYYLVRFDAGHPDADVDDGSLTGTLDGGVTIEDLLFFLIRFDLGC